MSRPAPPVPAPSSSHARLLSRLKNRHLALLAHIDHAGSLTRAAAALGISQPAATKTLAELETIFGAPLFNRAGVRLAPTELGRLAIVRANHMLQALANWGQEMDTVRAGHRAHLSIGAVPYISDELLANTLTILHREHGIATTLVRATSDQLSTALARHDIDCLIGRYAAQAQSETFSHQLLFEQRPALIAHPSLAVRLTKQTPDWRQLAKMDWILPPPSTPIGTQTRFSHLLIMKIFMRIRLRTYCHVALRRHGQIALRPNIRAHDVDVQPSRDRHRVTRHRRGLSLRPRRVLNAVGTRR